MAYVYLTLQTAGGPDTVSQTLSEQVMTDTKGSLQSATGKGDSRDVYTMAIVQRVSCRSMERCNARSWQ